MAIHEVVWSKNEKANETMSTIGSTLQDIENAKQATCRICGAIVFGENLGEILDLMGLHADTTHPEVNKEK